MAIKFRRFPSNHPLFVTLVLCRVVRHWVLFQTPWTDCQCNLWYMPSAYFKFDTKEKVLTGKNISVWDCDKKSDLVQFTLHILTDCLDTDVLIRYGVYLNCIMYLFNGLILQTSEHLFCCFFHVVSEVCGHLSVGQERSQQPVLSGKCLLITRLVKVSVGIK